MRLGVRSGVLALVVVLGACVGEDPDSSSSGNTTDGGSGKALGTRCSPGESCANGSCVDGYCCDKACNGQCEACDVEGKQGQCTPVTGKPHHQACDGDASGACAGACDGKTTATCTYPDTECAPGACAAGLAKIPSKCKAGTCPATQAVENCTLGCFENGCLGVKEVAAGSAHACALLTDTKVRCWGANNAGQTGQADAVGTQPKPAEVYLKPNDGTVLANVQQIAASNAATCALLADKTIVCWGSNQFGELGRGGPVDNVKHRQPEPVINVAGATAIFGAHGSGNHFCAIVAGGQVRCWGAGFNGQLGSNSQLTTQAVPVTVCDTSATLPCPPMTGVKFIAGGDNFTCAIQANDEVACWGNNSVKQCGSNTNGQNQLRPRIVAGLSGATYLTGGNAISCAAAAGGAKCWGGGLAGHLGNATNDISVIPPVDVCTKQDCSTKLDNVTAISTADESVCALSGGAVKCWGSNNSSQLGDGTGTGSSNYAASAAIASGAVAITSGGTSNFAIVVEGLNRDVRCWGANQSNHCGNETNTTTAKSPISPTW